jgi:hypothetical protein
VEISNQHSDDNEGFFVVHTKTQGILRGHKEVRRFNFRHICYTKGGFLAVLFPNCTLFMDGWSRPSRPA